MGGCCGSTTDQQRGNVTEDGNVPEVKRGKSVVGNTKVHRDKKLVRDYILGAQLGQGSYGEVRECQHKETKAKRAFKILRKVRLDEAEKKRMDNEIDCLKNLDHPNILRMYESYECEKRYYIVTDISRGGELFDEIAKNRFFTEPNAQ